MARRDLILVLPLLLAACGEPVSEYEKEASVAAPASEPAAPPPAPVPVLTWTGASSVEGQAMVLSEDGAEVLRLVCPPEGGMKVYAVRFKPVDSEERMTVGAGDVAVTMVATNAATRNPPAVQASAPVDLAMLEAVEAGGKIAANYGYQNAGPYDAPPPEVAKAFTGGCRSGVD
jgi:hypothetical protein